jgi:abelson tyrosine-protein kinase 1/abelson tyrosine-protein kinase 2
MMSILPLSSPVENVRPPLPPSSFSCGPLMDVIRSSWDFTPSRRPSFNKIARDIKKMRAERLNTFPSGDSPKPIPLLDQWGVHYPYHHSPDILPQPLPNSVTPTTPPMDNLQNAVHPGSALGLDIGQGVPDLPATGPTRSSSISSVTLASSASTVNRSVVESSYPVDEIAAKYQDERRYRMLLQHDYHTIRGSYIRFLYCCAIGSLMFRSDAPTLAAVSRRTRRRGLFVET